MQSSTRSPLREPGKFGHQSMSTFIKHTRFCSSLWLSIKIIHLGNHNEWLTSSTSRLLFSFRLIMTPSIARVIWSETFKKARLSVQEKLVAFNFITLWSSMPIFSNYQLQHRHFTEIWVIRLTFKIIWTIWGFAVEELVTQLFVAFQNICFVYMFFCQMWENNTRNNLQMLSNSN